MTTSPRSESGPENVSQRVRRAAHRLEGNKYVPVGIAAAMGAAGVLIGLSTMPDSSPEPQLRPHDPAAVVEIIEPHREQNYAYPGGLSEYVPGEVRVEQCADSSQTAAGSGCPEFRVIIEDAAQFEVAVSEPGIVEGDMVVPAQLTGSNS